MAVFKDDAGRDWRLTLTRWHIGKLKTEYDVNLDKAMTSIGGLASEVFDDTGEKAVRALWFLCEKQAQERGVSEEDFALMLAADLLETARQALTEELANFSPRSMVGSLMKSEKNRRAFWARIGAEMEATMQKALNQLSQADSVTS